MLENILEFYVIISLKVGDFLKLQVFEFIDETLKVLRSKRAEIEDISGEIETYFSSLLQKDHKYLNITKRVKSEDSLKEKILRQNYFLRYRFPELVIDKLRDLIGLRIEVRFIRDEAEVYRKLYGLFTENIEGTDYYSTPDRKEIQLKVRETQPQKQHNGFEIYKIDGRYQKDNICYHFELQIKSFVNIFWGDIDHRILYKNYNYVITEDFIREMMYSIRDNLEMVDAQLVAVYNHLYKMESESVELSKSQLKKLISKLIHDIFLIRFKSMTGIVLDFRKPIDLIVDYIFSKAYYENVMNHTEYFVKIMNRLNEIAKKELAFGEYIQLSQDKNMKGEFCNKLGSGIESIMNLDLKWNLVLSIIFELEGGDKTEEFVSFVEYIVFTIIYRIRTSLRRHDLDTKKEDEITNKLATEVFDFICEEYNADFFSLSNMRILEGLVDDFIENVEDLDNIEEFSYREFSNRLESEAEV